MIFVRRTKNLLGIDISSSSIKLIELSINKKRRYKIETYAIVPLPEGCNDNANIFEPEIVAEVIKKAITLSGTKTRCCALAIPSSVTMNKIINIPANISSSEIETQVYLEAERHIPYPMEEVNFDYEILGKSKKVKNNMDILLVATRSENVEKRVAAAEMAHLKVEIMDTEANSQEQVLQMLTTELVDKNTSVAIIDFGATTSAINVFEEGRITFSHEQNFGGRNLTTRIMQKYGLSWQEAGLAKKNGHLPNSYIHELLEPFKQDIVRYAHRFLQFYFAAHQKTKIDKVLLTGGCSLILGIDEQIEAEINAETQIANPFRGVNLSPKINPKSFTQDIPTLLIATGLSLRRFI